MTDACVGSDVYAHGEGAQSVVALANMISDIMSPANSQTRFGSSAVSTSSVPEQPSPRVCVRAQLNLFVEVVCTALGTLEHRVPFERNQNPAKPSGLL
jgi:hypothetical protein